MIRPDQSNYLAHFTRNGKEYVQEDMVSGLDSIPVEKMSARDKLVNILKIKRIIANNTPWTNQNAVCFTECPWSSLLRHAQAYSPYGIGFSKKLVYSRDGNPVFYVNPSLYNNQEWNKAVYPFITPFVPSYAADSIKNKKPFNGKVVDYTHEREWRVPRDFPFQYKYIKFIVLDTYDDLNYIPSHIIEEIGKDKVIFMDTYRKIEELWPTHLMN